MFTKQYQNPKLCVQCDGYLKTIKLYENTLQPKGNTGPFLMVSECSVVNSPTLSLIPELCVE